METMNEHLREQIEKARKEGMGVSITGWYWIREAMEAYSKEQCIAFIDGIRDYMHESHNRIDMDDRTSEEFYDIFIKNQS